MTVRVMIEYGVWEDKEYYYIIPFETTFKRQCNVTFWRERFIREISSMGLHIKYIKILKEEYISN